VVKEIPLTRGKVAIVDDEDYEVVSAFKWHCTSHGYASRVNPETKKREYLHRFLVKPSVGNVVDHINHDKLDNRRSNLRECTQKQNMHNGRGVAGTSRYKGVSYKPGRRKPWRARLYINGEQLILGDFYTEEEAAYAYNLKATEVNGQYAFLNDVKIDNFTPFSPKKTSSNHRGVHWCKRKERWRATLKVNGRQKHLGYFKEEEEAADAYLKAAKGNMQKEGDVS